MPLLGQAAMLLSFDIANAAIPEHDEWHTHEHLPERLAVPGFIRGTRWIALACSPRYFVMYEVEQLATLLSESYLERLNNPTPWTSRMMRHYRGMSRGFCSVAASFGFGIGHFGLLIRFKPIAGSPLHDWLCKEALPKLPARPGIGSAHLLETAITPAMTSEQRVRGADAGFDSALLITGYDSETLESVGHADLGVERLARQGAEGVQNAMYRVDYMLNSSEVAA